MSRMKTSWLLMKQSCTVLFANKKLLVFPLMSLSFIGFILLFFFSFFLLRPTGHSYFSEDHWKANSRIVDEEVGEIKSQEGVEINTNEVLDPKKGAEDKVAATNIKENDRALSTSISGDTSQKAIGLKAKENSSNTQKNGIHKYKTFQPFSSFFMISVYLISMILMTFFNTAFFNEIIHALNGQTVSIVGGLKFAISKWKSILFWALFAATIGMIINKIGENLGFIGRFLLGLIGMAWSVATVFAIPVIIKGEQSPNPIKVLKTSGRLIKEKWGEGLIGYIGIEGFGFVFFISFSIVCGALVILAYFLEFSGYYIYGLGAFWLFILISVFYIQSIVNNIFKCALYLYATEGVLPLGFDEDEVNKVWKVKKKKDQ